MTGGRTPVTALETELNARYRMPDESIAIPSSEFEVDQRRIPVGIFHDD